MSREEEPADIDLGSPIEQVAISEQPIEEVDEVKDIIDDAPVVQEAQVTQVPEVSRASETLQEPQPQQQSMNETPNPESKQTPMPKLMTKLLEGLNLQQSLVKDTMCSAHNQKALFFSD